jgi:hypothetical protein
MSGVVMGGCGSGRWGSWTKRYTVEECQALSVKDLNLDAHEGTEAVLTIERFGAAHHLKAVSSPCRFGGVRWWLECFCGRRAAVLYQPPKTHFFACRHCHSLTYRSAQEAHEFDGLFRVIAAGMGVMPKVAEAALQRGYSKRTIRLLDAALGHGPDLARVVGRMNRRKRKT